MGQVPDPNAKRRNLDGKFSIVDWTELTNGEDVPPMPDGRLWGKAACEVWDDLWRGPFRSEFLPQHRHMLKTLLTIIDKMEDEEMPHTTYLNFVDRLRQFSDRFGLDPAAVRKLRVTVNPDNKAVKPEDAATAEEDELAARREMQNRIDGTG